MKVADFGIARMIEPETGRADLPVSPEIGAAQQHGPTGVIGTPSYSAPEQKNDPQRVDSRADIYSLGVVFYEMLTGELPGKKIAPPSTKVQIDVRLDEIVLRALEQKPELRYQQVSEVKTMVETIVATPPAEDQKNANASIPKNRFGRIVLVGISNGKREINWTGVIQMWVVIYAAFLAGSYIAFGRWVPFHDLISGMVGVATLVTGALVKVELKKPIEQLLPGSSRREAHTEPSQAGVNKRQLTGFQILLRSVVVAFVAGLLVFALAAAVTSLLPRTYAATARVELSSQDPNFLQNEFARMESPEFLKQVAATADLKTRWKSSLSGNEAEQMEQITVRLRNEMELRPVRNTRLIEICFYSESPGEAADIANAITTVYCRQPGTTIVDNAKVPARPVRPNAMLNLAIGAVGGGFFGLVAGGLTALFLAGRKSHPSSSSRGNEAHSEKSETGNRKPEIVPRFSRTAIVGAAWLTWFFVLMPPFLWHEGRTHEFENAGPFASPLMVFVFFVFILPAFTAPFGVTMAGWIAVSQIRRSAGKIYGLWLAVFDGLVFPLFVVDGAIAWLWLVLAKLFARQVLHMPDSLFLDLWDMTIWIALACASIAWVDYLIVRRVWRAVNKSGAGVPPADPGSSRREEARTEKSEIGNRKSEIAPRFSRMAIVGACWAAFFVVVLTLYFISKIFPDGFSGHSLLMAYGIIIVGGITILLGFTAPFGTTILGWVAVSQIRRSAGKLYGLWLAVFDGLLFPLLVLDVLIWAGLLFGLAPTIEILDRALHWNVGRLDWIAISIVPAIFILGVIDWFIIRAVWRAVMVPTGSDSSMPAGGHRTSRVAIAVVLGIVVLGILGATLFFNKLAGPPTSPASLAQSPFELQKRPTADVIQAGLAEPISPWAWQELERRPLTGAEAGQIMDGLVAWLQQKHPGGFTQPLSWLDEFLNRLAERRLINQQQELTFLQALHGNLRCEPLPRLREGVRTLDVQVACRNIWTRDLFGLVMMNELRSATVDGQPVKLQYYLGRWWDHDNVNGRLELPALAPGKHMVKLEVLSVLATKNDLIGLASDAPSTDWPTGKIRWIRTAELELLVYAKDAQIVSLTDDPAFDPVANGYLSASQVIIRPKAGHLTAVVVTGAGSKPGQAVSVEVTLRLAGKSYKCGSLMSWKSADGTTSSSSGGELKADLDSLDPQIKEAEIVMTPNPQAVESRAGIDRIWGKDIVFSHVPLTRQDLPGAVTVETTTPPVANASGAASPSAAPVERVSYRTGISFIGLFILAGAGLVLVGLLVAGLIWFLRRKNTTSTGKAIAIGCGVLVAGGLLVLLLAAVVFIGLLHTVRQRTVIENQEMVQQKQLAQQQMEQAKARAQAMQAESKQMATGANPSFGPVVERVVNLVGGTNTAIDLNSGRFVARPTFEYSTNEETNENDSLEAFRFNKKNSVDVVGAVEIPLMGTNGSFAPLPITEKLNGLDCEDGTFALQTEASNWDSAPADWVTEHAKNIKPVWDTCHMSGMGELPKVYLFKTREGSLGILQITGFTENPRGVKIRYKLVQPTGSQTDAAALQFRLVLPEDSTAASDQLPDVSGHGQLRVSREALLDGSAVAQAGLDFNPDGTRKIEI